MNTPAAAMTMPTAMQTKTKNEKYPFAFSGSCSPSFLPMIADPPVPSIRPNTPSTEKIGNVTFTDAKATFPTKLEINSPSTIP